MTALFLTCSLDTKAIPKILTQKVYNNNLIGVCWFFTLLWIKKAAGLPLPQGGGSAAGGHGQPQAGSPSTPGPGGGTAGSGASSTFGAAGGSASGPGIGVAVGSGAVGFGVTGGTTGGGAGGGAASGGAASGGAADGGQSWPGGPTRRGRGWRDWRRGDPTLIKGLWKSKGPLGKPSVLHDFCTFISFISSHLYFFSN